LIFHALHPIFEKETHTGPHIGAYRCAGLTKRGSYLWLFGYVSLSYAHPQADFGKIPNTAPQILVSSVSPRSGDNEGGFRNDGALFIGGEPFEGVGTVIELHFVGNASPKPKSYGIWPGVMAATQPSGLYNKVDESNWV